jgi:hypothetical protein
MDFNTWDRWLREMLNGDTPPLKLHSGRYWEVKDKHGSLILVKDRLFDRQLDLIKEIAVEVLTEVDPKFELVPDKHYAANIFGKKLRHSNNIREGLSETLVWLGINGDSLKNCSPDKRKFIAHSIVREIFADASWQLWGSLNQLLPTLAEAAPGEFLDAVESALRKAPSPFDELFSQEGDGFSGANHLTGLYWALEGLAWDEDYLARVCVILAELAEHDPGGRWANRPANSITTILLPWHPQTLAPIEKRLAAVRAIRKDSPQTAWKVLLSLLPNSHQSTSGSHKPKWRNPLPEDWKLVVTNGEYSEQVIQYAAIAVEMACEDLTKTNVLVGNMDNLPEPSFEVFLNYLSSDVIVSLAESERKSIWEKLTEFANKHRRYANAKWALQPDIVDRLDCVIELLKPTSSVVLYERLFSNRDFDLYDENGDWKEEEKKLATKRKNAIEEILAVGGLEAVIGFSGKVESSARVGLSLGSINIQEHDAYLLPSFLEFEDEANKNFIANFIWGRYQQQGWGWADDMDKSDWSKDQICHFLIFLPFAQDAWSRAAVWLGDDERLYWERANVNPYQTEDDLTPAIDKLLEFGRPVAVIDCLYCGTHKKLPLDISRAISALMLAFSSNEFKNSLGYAHIADLISALQEDQATPFDDMCQIEWLYLPLLQRGDNAEPKFLHKKLSIEPEFFCEVISYIYRSKDDPKNGVEEDEIKKQVATNAWHLLYDWSRTPGLQDDGSFSVDQFTEWFNDARKLCEGAGRLDVAMTEIGKVLRYAPSDPDGLWINRFVLDVLDDRYSERLREGFVSEVFNSRGAHWVDPTGKPERDLAEEWSQKANVVEMVGYTRFAAELKRLADSYNRDAERIIRAHESEDD